MLRHIAASASWLRWAGERMSLLMACSEGRPSTVGDSSAGLHIAGAAHLESTASRLARASGVSQPLDRAHAVDVLAPDGDAAPPRAVVVGEGAVRVQTIGQLVGQHAEFVGAELGGLLAPDPPRPWLGRTHPPSWGSWWKKRPISATWAVLICPARCAVGGGGPQRRQAARRSIVVRAPSISASAMRRRASPGPDAQPGGQRLLQRAADLLGGGRARRCG